jgi:transposase
MKQNNIIPIYNVPYSPETNPIETIFSKVKHIYRRQYRTNSSNVEKNIHKAFKSITIDDIKNCYINSFKLV